MGEARERIGRSEWPGLFPKRPKWGIDSNREMLPDAIAVLRLTSNSSNVRRAVETGDWGRLAGGLEGLAESVYKTRWPVDEDASRSLRANWERAVGEAINLVRLDNNKRLRRYGRVECGMSLQEARGIPARLIRLGLLGGLGIVAVGGLHYVVGVVNTLQRQPEPVGQPVDASPTPEFSAEFLKEVKLFTLDNVDSLGGATDVWGGVPDFRVVLGGTELPEHDDIVSLTEFDGVVEKLGVERGLALPFMGEILRSGFGAGMVVVKGAAVEGKLLPFARNLELRLPEGKGSVRLEDVRRLTEVNDYPRFSSLRGGGEDRISEPLILCGQRDCAVLLPLDYDYMGYSYHSSWKIYPVGGENRVSGTPGGVWMRIAGGYWYDEGRKLAIATNVVFSVGYYLSFRSKEKLREVWGLWLPAGVEIADGDISEDLPGELPGDPPHYWYDVPVNQLWPIVDEGTRKGLFAVARFSLGAVEALEVKVDKVSQYPFAVGPDGTKYPSTHKLTRRLLEKTEAVKNR